jgi:hypothetical protein
MLQTEEAMRETIQFEIIHRIRDTAMMLRVTSAFSASGIQNFYAFVLMPRIEGSL